MAVTDLTDSLPWWARQGAGPTGGPGAAPQGAGVGGQPPPGMNQQAWLAYLMSMFGPGAAQAAENDPMGTLRSGGTPVAAALTSGGPPVPPSVASDPSAAPNPYAGPQPGLSAPNYTNPFLAAGATPGAGLDAAALIRSPGGATTTPGAGPLPNVPAPAAQPVSAVPGPLATGGAGGQGATSNPRFVQVDRPNADPTGRGGGPPQMTALNLAGLFGGGQPAAAAAPAGPLARQPSMQHVSPRFAGPVATAPGRTQMGPAALASAISKPNWWQGLGRPDMTADQLARAVKQRNWWQNV